MQPMSRPDVNPGATETQQMRITAPTGVSKAQRPPPPPPLFLADTTLSLRRTG